MGMKGKKNGEIGDASNTKAGSKGGFGHDVSKS
jgi:hypothetical protein